ncbi:MAG TPA: hypothetical protein VF471_15055 [Pseudoxanthomonas sp.]
MPVHWSGLLIVTGMHGECGATEDMMVKRSTYGFLLALAAVLSGCDRGAALSVPDAAVPSTGAWPAKFAFKVAVSLSASAERKLRQDAESVVVSVSYAGTPAQNIAPSDINDIGLVDIGRTEATLDGSGIVVFDGRAADRRRLGLTTGEPEMLVSLYSGRRFSSDNLLDCDTYQEEVRRASGKTLHLSCRLLSERN